MEVFVRKLIHYFSRNIFIAKVLVIYFPLFLLRNKKGVSKSPIFIIGAPRTGSTILYQALTNCFEVKYIDNMAAFWHRNLPFGMWLSHRKFGLTPHNNFLSEHGDTNRFGEHAPSECGQFWYRWLPKENHFVDHSQIPQKLIDTIKRELSEVSKMFGLPLLIKNLNMGQRLRLIKDFAPDSKIIFIRRDPRFTVRSILKARKKVGISKNKIWSVRPKNFHDLEALSEIDMCAGQVYYLEKQIINDLALFPSSNVRFVQYNYLSKKLLKELADWLDLDHKNEPFFPQFKKDKVDQIPLSELRNLEESICKYDFIEGMSC